jgi:hypothetical protein
MNLDQIVGKIIEGRRSRVILHLPTNVSSPLPECQIAES